MMKLLKSALFMRQWQEYAQDYKNRAGMEIAERFIVSVEQALKFIEQNVYACPAYEMGKEYHDLQAYRFRKWNVQGFPHKVLFQLKDEKVIVIEVLYAHKMDISARLNEDRDRLAQESMENRWQK